MTCTATTASGEPCTAPALQGQDVCVFHSDRARQARARGGETTARRTTKVRTVSPDAVPGGKAPETLDDCIVWASWLTFASVTGLLDGVTVREANRSLGTLKDSLHKRDLLARIRVLERQLREFEQERVA